MPWVVDGIIARELATGAYMGHEWQRFCGDYQIEWDVIDLPGSLPAVLYNETILLRRGMRPLETAWYAWHEIGHFVIHVGNQRFWQSLVCGDLIVRKQEAQADYFAVTYPVWSAQDLRALRDLGLYREAA